jgi:chromate transporter
MIESTRTNSKFTVPLSTVSAAVVGVIFQLAMFFVVHVVWPNGLSGSFDVFSAILALMALMLLAKVKLNAMWVLAVCAACGFAYKSLNF